MNKNSLRLRLICFFVLIAAGVGICAAYFSWRETRENLDEFFDTYQLALARQLAAADWNILNAASAKDISRQIKKLDADEDEAIGFAVFDQDGKRIFHDNENGLRFQFYDGRGFQTTRVDGDQWRLVWLSAGRGHYRIAVGQELDYRDDIAWDMAEEFLLPWLIGLLVLLIATIAIITRELSPLNRLAAKLQHRAADDLSPLPPAAVPAEIMPLIQAMNRQLEQISALLLRERSFISDSAHELRTPLTALQVQLEVARLSEDDAAARRKALNNLQSGIRRTARLVEQLLALSKADASAVSVVNQPLDWPQLIAAAVKDIASAAAAKDIKINTNIDGQPPFASGSSLLCSLLLRNLMDNAVKYSPPGADISLSLKNRSLIIINSKTEVPPEVLGRLGNRFFRPAGSREDGSGLGLAIVQTIAANHHCRLQLENTPHGFCVTITAKA